MKTKEQLIAHRKTRRETRKRYRLQGLCVCGRELEQDKKTCAVCTKYRKQQRKNYRKRGLCFCSKPIDEKGFLRCSKCRSAVNAKNRELKEEVLEGI